MGKRTKKRNKHFPRKLTREMLRRAERGVGKWTAGLTTIAEEALYDRICRENGKPLFGFSGHLGERLTFALLRLYGKMLPWLGTGDVSREDAVWVFVKDVVVPTAFIELALNWRRGLGTEFQLETCWYLPVAERGERLTPVARGLKCWFRAAGFRYTHDLSKVLDDSLRKKLDLWLGGECPRYLSELHELVETFADDVRWLDSPDSWKARFTLARAMQKLCDAMDGFFGAKHPHCSLDIVEMLRGIGNERVPLDVGHELANSFCFFAARLLKRRLEHEGTWAGEVERHVQEVQSRKWPADPAEDARFREELHRDLNAGNWFLRFIEGEVAGCGEGSFHERVLDLGVRELNRVLAAQRGRRAKARQP